MSDLSRRTIIEEGTEVEGSVRSNCHVDVSGMVRGNITAPALTVSESGRVDGKISVEKLRSSGEISGEIEAESIELSGTVGDETVVRARSLEVKLADPRGRMQVSFGNCSLQIGQKFGIRDGVVESSTSTTEKEPAY
jgi:cytoskeletal protein CcmA (bactofilin family)